MSSSERGLEPGTIDQNYVRPADVRLDADNPNARNISPGQEGTDLTRIADRRTTNRSPMPPTSVFDMQVIEIVRLTGQQLCPVRGCTHSQKGKAPFEFKTLPSLRQHVQARHPEVDPLYIMRTMTLLLEKKP